VLNLIKEIGAFAGLASFLGLTILALLSFTQGRDLRRLREWAGSAPERDAERKDATSTAAAQRAEELRKLEEARTAEREAASMREERRRRREAGLPDYTRMERFRDRLSSFGERLAEPRYLAAVFAVVIVVGGAAAYAALHGFGGGGGGGAGGGAGKALKPGDIEVAVLNGTGVNGLAGNYSAVVARKGFKKGSVGDTSSIYGRSFVMFRRGYRPEAHRVSQRLGIEKLRPMTSGIASISGGAPVSVILGEDNVSASG
jgi:LytR cell envelope-related transcriptional attenuator